MTGQWHESQTILCIHEQSTTVFQSCSSLYDQSTEPFRILLAAAFGMFGFNKLSQPIESLEGMMPWVTAVPALLVRFIGTAEIAGALGMILPGLTKIQPRLTAYAGVGLALIMVLAAAFHASRGEFGNIGFNAVLLVLAAVVAYGRWPRK